MKTVSVSKFALAFVAMVGVTVLTIGSAEAGPKTSKASSYNRSVAVGVGIGPLGSGGGLGYSVSKSDVESVGKGKGASADSGGSFIGVGIGYKHGSTMVGGGLAAGTSGSSASAY